MQLISERNRAIFESMSEEEKSEFLAVKFRIRQVADAVRDYKTAEARQSQPLYYYLRGRGFSNDEIWIHSPHIGGAVGADEPDWV